MTNLLALQPGTELVSDYRIERVLGAGGFGITYLAEELALDRRVTIKEYFPSDFAARDGGDSAAPRSQECAGDYSWGLDRFIDEAQILARFDHKNIVRVYRYFKANNTAYMVLSFEEGHSLKGWLRSLGRAPRQKELDAIVPPLLDALELVHKADYLHRDIAPDNIIIRPNGEPVLIDFGAARGEIAAHSKTVSALVKPGYSPYEQYAERSSQQGPWTDIYALGATLYHAVTGKRPPDAPSRMVKDDIVPAREAALSSYRHGFLAAIDRALALNIEARPQSVAAWRGDLMAPDPKKPGWFSRGAAAARPAGPDRAKPAMPANRPSATMPIPDAPGPQGGILDLIDGLKQKVEPPPAKPAPAKAAPAARARAAQPPADVVSMEKPAMAPTEVLPAGETVKPKLPVKPPRPPRHPRPRRVRAVGEKRRWMSLLVKLMIGAGVAYAAVELRDNGETRVVTRSASTVASQRTNVTKVRTLRGHTGPVRSVAVTDGGRTLVSIGEDRTLRVWDAASASLSRTIELDDGAATALAVSGRRALTGSTVGTMTLWDLDTAAKLKTFKRNAAEIWALAFAPDGQRFAAGAHDWSVAIWSTDAGSDPQLVYEGHKNAVQALAFSPDGRRVATGGADTNLKLWNTVDPGLVRTYRGHKDFVTALTFRPDGRMLASAALDGTVRLWSTASSRLQRSRDRHEGRVTGLAFSGDGQWLATSGEDGQVRIFEVRRGRELRTLRGHTGAIRAVAFLPGSAPRIVSAGDDATIRIWDLPSLAGDGE